MDTPKKNLYRLDELSGYKVASHYHDVRGWKLVDADNRTIGKVDDLLVNKATERVVYLDVEVDKDLIEEGHEPYETSVSEGAHEFLDKDGHNHLIVPIGAVNLDESNKQVISNAIGFDTFRKSKKFSKGQNLDRNYEVQIINIYYPGDTASTTAGSSHSDDNDDESFYNRSQFNRPD